MSILKQGEALLKQGEALAITSWSCPEVGDVGRGVVRFDTDPMGDCATSLRSIITDVRVWFVESPCSGGDYMFVYFKPVEKIAHPESISVRESDLAESWGGIELWRPGDIYTYAQFIPAHAIKQL